MLTFVRGDFRNRRVSRNWTLVVVVVMCSVGRAGSEQMKILEAGARASPHVSYCICGGTQSFCQEFIKQRGREHFDWVGNLNLLAI